MIDEQGSTDGAGPSGTGFTVYPTDDRPTGPVPRVESSVPRSVGGRQAPSSVAFVKDREPVGQLTLLWGPPYCGKTNLLWAISQAGGVQASDSTDPAADRARRITLSARRASEGQDDLADATDQVSESDWRSRDRAFTIADVPGELARQVGEYIDLVRSSDKIDELIRTAQQASGLMILLDPTGQSGAVALAARRSQVPQPDRSVDNPVKAAEHDDYTVALLQLVQSRAKQLLGRKVAVVLTKLDHPDVLCMARPYLTWPAGRLEAPFLTSSGAENFLHEVLAADRGPTGIAARGIVKDLEQFRNISYFAISSLGFRSADRTSLAPRANPFKDSANAQVDTRAVLGLVERSTQRIEPLLAWMTNDSARQA